MNETKRNGYNSILAKNPFKTFLITLLSLILLFSISCSNEDKTGDKSETTEIGNFPPPEGTYIDKTIKDDFSHIDYETKVSTVVDTTTIKGLSKKTLGSGQRFGFDISKWKKNNQRWKRY